MEVTEVEQLLRILDSSLSHIKWRLKFHAKHRLQTDVLALFTEMRPVIMVDYGGKMPELQEHLCALLKLCQQNIILAGAKFLNALHGFMRKESSTFEHLRVMIIEDMIYLIHVKGLAEFVKSSLDSKVELLFVNLEQDPPKMVTQAEKSSIATDLLSVQKLFSLYFPVNDINSNVSSCHLTDNVAIAADNAANAESSVNKPITSQSSALIDLSSCMQETQVTVPTLNGWLLCYPVVYLFSKEHIADAIYNLSTKYLRIFQIFVSRKVSPNKGSRVEELMRILEVVVETMVRDDKGELMDNNNLSGLRIFNNFSVPYELSMGGSKEPWAEAFLAQMQSRWEKCKEIWSPLQMEVSECYPQAIAL